MINMNKLYTKTTIYKYIQIICINILLLSEYGVFGAVVVPVNRMNIENKMKLDRKTIKNIKRGVTLGTSFGASLSASIPLMGDIIKLPNEIDVMKSKLGHKLDMSHEIIEHPSDVIEHTDINNIGEMWSYSTFLKNINEDNILGVSVSQDGKCAYVIENNDNLIDTLIQKFDNIQYIQHTDDIYNIIPADSIHKVITLPLHINELIDKLVEYNINFDIVVK